MPSLAFIAALLVCSMGVASVGAVGVCNNTAGCPTVPPPSFPYNHVTYPSPSQIAAVQGFYAAVKAASSAVGHAPMTNSMIPQDPTPQQRFDKLFSLAPPVQTWFVTRVLPATLHGATLGTTVGETCYRVSNVTGPMLVAKYNAAAGNSTAQAAIIKALLQDVTMLQGQLNGSSTAFKAAYMAANEFVTGNGGVAGLERATNALLGRCGNVNATLTVLNDTLRAAQANMSKCPTSNTTCASYWAGVINSTTAKLRAEEELGVLCAGPQGQLLAQLHNTGNAMDQGVGLAFGTAFELMQGTSSNVAGNAGMLIRQLSGSIGINFFTNALLRTMAKGCGDFFGVTYAFATNACQTLCPH